MSTLRAVFSAIIAALPMCLPVSAQAIKGAGVGLASCGSWTAGRAQDTSFSEEQWVLGFLSGVAATGSIAGAPELDPLAGIRDLQGVWAWLDNFCRSNPRATIEWAAASFVAEHPPK